MNSTLKDFFPKIKLFFRQIRVLAWFELFEKWFGFLKTLLWISLAVIFARYLYKEYKREAFYLNTFLVPPSWEEKGFSGEVVRQMIVDNIDQVRKDVYYQDSNLQTARPSEQDNSKILSEINISGFNLKAITESLMGILGKQKKTIGGFVTLTDTTQNIAIQISGQMTQTLKISQNRPNTDLIRLATLEIMKLKDPQTVLSYYYAKGDLASFQKVFRFLQLNRSLIRNFDFYRLAGGNALVERDSTKAIMWADSALVAYPNDKWALYQKAHLYGNLIYFPNIDSQTRAYYKKKYVEYLFQALDKNSTLMEGANDPTDYIYFYLARFYGFTSDKKDYKKAIDYMQKAIKLMENNASAYNDLAYFYVGLKDFSNAEKAVKKATFLEPDNGNYWDSYAELFSLQNKDSLAVVYLKKALQSAKGGDAVSVEAYKKDPRWERLQSRKDFQELLKANPPKK